MTGRHLGVERHVRRDNETRLLRLEHTIERRGVASKPQVLEHIVSAASVNNQEGVGRDPVLLTYGADRGLAVDNGGQRGRKDVFWRPPPRVIAISELDDGTRDVRNGLRARANIGKLEAPDFVHHPAEAIRVSGAAVVACLAVGVILSA